MVESDLFEARYTGELIFDCNNFTNTENVEIYTKYRCENYIWRAKTKRGPIRII